jgi:hypothetical protein
MYIVPYNRTQVDTTVLYFLTSIWKFTVTNIPGNILFPDFVNTISICSIIESISFWDMLRGADMILMIPHTGMDDCR